MIWKNITGHAPAGHSKNVAARCSPVLSAGERSMKATINGSKARLAGRFSSPTANRIGWETGAGGLCQITGRSYRCKDRRIATSRLLLTAKHPQSYYRPYAYFQVHTGPAASKLPCDVGMTAECMEEWLTRDRRTVNFTDASDLTPVKYRHRRHQVFWERVGVACHCDHQTLWTSPLGALFCLNEPYHGLDSQQTQLTAAGLAVIAVPTDLSPYCGGWGGAAGAMPGTKSYLIADAKDAAELKAVMSKLTAAAPTALRWNDTRGISHD